MRNNNNNLREAILAPKSKQQHQLQRANDNTAPHHNKAKDQYLGCVCLEVKYGGQKTLDRKQEGKIFQSVFGWMERRENKLWDLSVFSPDPSKSSLQNEEKTKRKKLMK